jgi:hypothetical protein
VPAGLPIVLTSKGAWSDVKPGAAASVAATKAADGTLTAALVTVGRDGARPGT